MSWARVRCTSTNNKSESKKVASPHWFGHLNQTNRVGSRNGLSAGQKEEKKMFAACVGFCIIFFGYIAQTLALQYWFYYKRGDSARRWKIQPPPPPPPCETNTQKTTDTDTETVKEREGPPIGGNLHELYGLPLLSNKPHRAPYHRWLTTLNLVVASLACAFTTEFCARGWNKMQFHAITDGTQALYVVAQFLLAVVYESVVEYYWHRLMHWRFFYRYMHKFHHMYKSPEPWDDMYIHPLEAFGYYCILYGPPFLFPIHLYAFLAYMVVMGICGVLDHSGIKFELPGLYNTVDHDRHHEKFEVNYSFPFPFMDMLHGTYEGTFLGKAYQVRNRIRRAAENGIKCD